MKSCTENPNPHPGWLQLKARNKNRKGKTKKKLHSAYPIDKQKENNHLYTPTVH